MHLSGVRLGRILNLLLFITLVDGLENEMNMEVRAECKCVCLKR